VLKLQRSSPLQTIAYSIIKEYGFTPAQTKEVIGLLDSDSGRYVASASHRIIRNRNWLIITPNATGTADNILVEAGEKKILFSKGELLLEAINSNTPSTNDLVATMDLSEIQFPLLLRRWKQGDYFYPLGMKKKKKLSRFLIDKKVPLHEKENTWVLESNKRIVWVIGHRIDDRFKITSSTKRVLKISLRIL